MIVTVTPNPAVDRILVVPRFAAGRTNRGVVERTDIGGKGINVARHLTRLDCSALATGFLGTGNSHGVVEALDDCGLHTDFVRVAGDTRVNLKVLDPVTGVETEINEPGPTLLADAVESLLAKLRALADRCTVMVLSGSLPPGAPDDFYAQAIRIARSAGIKTVLDAAGAALRHGITAEPDVVKPNRTEAQELLGMPRLDDDGLVEAARRLLDCGARTPVISAAEAGAVSASAAGAWRARPPAISARSSVGAGDAMVAGLAYGLLRSLSQPDALQLAVALGTASAASDAPVPEPGATDALLPHVVIERVSQRSMPPRAARISR